MIKRLRDSLRTLLGRDRFEREMAAELEAHLEHLVDDLMAQGISRREALRRARASFGSVDGVKEEARAARGVRWADELRGDLRYAFRALKHSLAYTAVAVLTLALGIGANTTIFSVVNGVLIKPLPFPESSRLVHVTRDYPLGSLWIYRADGSSYSAVAAYAYWSEVNIFTADEPERIRGRRVSTEFFTVLAVEPALGRALRAGEDAPGAVPVAVISDGLWRRRFGADPAVIGRSVPVDGTPRDIVGVMPPGFAFPVAGTEIWLPVALDPKLQATVWGGNGATLSAGSSQGSRWLGRMPSIGP